MNGTLINAAAGHHERTEELEEHYADRVDAR